VYFRMERRMVFRSHLSRKFLELTFHNQGKFHSKSIQVQIRIVLFDIFSYYHILHRYIFYKVCHN